MQSWFWSGASKPCFATQQLDVGESAFSKELVLVGDIGSSVAQRAVLPGPIQLFGDDLQKQLKSFSFHHATIESDCGALRPRAPLYIRRVGEGRYPRSRVRCDVAILRLRAGARRQITLSRSRTITISRMRLMPPPP